MSRTQRAESGTWSFTARESGVRQRVGIFRRADGRLDIGRSEVGESTPGTPDAQAEALEEALLRKRRG